MYGGWKRLGWIATAFVAPICCWAGWKIDGTNLATAIAFAFVTALIIAGLFALVDA